MTQHTTIKQVQSTYPIAQSRARLSVWEKARGVLRGKKTHSVSELTKIRKEWNRKLPKLNNTSSR